MGLRSDIEAMLGRQKCDWATVRDNYASLSRALTRCLGDGAWVLQYNPERICSTAAKVDAKALAERDCFLCSEHQPAEQESIKWHGRYKIQVNPYPIFSRHFTVASLRHEPQYVSGRIGDMLELAVELGDAYVVFYNGPYSGASAPDHLHFQIGVRSELPLCNGHGSAAIRVSHITANSAGDATQECERVLSELPIETGEIEPRVNVVCYTCSGSIHILVFPRRRHRPLCYGTDEGQVLISPASVDLCGLITLPRKEDFENLDIKTIEQIIREVN